jgi:LDH2 family malate/lactate/ureidoglycolate dehydrogenase
VQAVLKDILGHGNEKCVLPGQLEFQSIQESKQHGGILFTQSEVDALAEIAKENGISFDKSSLKKISL